MNFFGIHWAGITNVLTFPIFFLLGYCIIKNYFRLKQAVISLTGLLHQKSILKNFSLRSLRWKSILLCVSLVFMFIALLQPQWGKKEQVVMQEGRDLLVVLDISRSMNAKDFKPSRLNFAKLKIRTLLSKLACERVGLILFSGSAFVQCPLTVDYAAFLMFLETVTTESIASGTTNLEAALHTLIDVFKGNPDRKHKLALLITDGEDFSGSIEHIQKQMLQEHITLFSLGVASLEGAPIPKFDDHGNQNGHEVDEKGSVVFSKLNENLLRTLSTKLHGHYVAACYDDADIDVIVKKITSYEKEKFTDKKISHYHDQYPWFLGVSLLCLVLEWII